MTQENKGNLAVAETKSVQAPLTVGSVYAIASSRKGRFVARLTDVDDTWATGVIVSGTAGAMLSYNEREVGEEVTVRREFCSFTPIKEQP